MTYQWKLAHQIWTHSVLLEAPILLALASLLGVPRARLERIRPPCQDLVDRLGPDTVWAAVGRRVLAALALTVDGADL